MAKLDRPLIRGEKVLGVHFLWNHIPLGEGIHIGLKHFKDIALFCQLNGNVVSPFVDISLPSIHSQNRRGITGLGQCGRAFPLPGTNLYDIPF